MKRVKYHKMGLNPHSKKWEQVSEKATLLNEEEAKILNADSKKTGIKYELAEADFDVETAKSDELKSFAKENGIDLGEATKKEDIKPIVAKWIEENK